jgi:CheY-like chemotaxis protein
MKSTQENTVLKILIADDDPDDRQLLALAFKEAKLNHIVNFVKNGEELMDHLRGISATEQKSLLPDLILLDLNMPKKDGRIALKEIKADPDFQKLNVIIFSTSISGEDNTYVTGLGVAKCITKPCGFYELVNIVKEICDSYAAISG